jgi:hypothetical protein
MTEKTWKEKWMANYRGEGDCQELETFLKELDYGSRKGVTYLPWAVVDRIFKMQGGVTETLFFPKTVEVSDGEEGTKTIQVSNTIVEVDSVHIRDEVDSNGVVTPKYMNSYFVRIKAEWEGQVHVERYPLLNSTGQALSFWTQTDLNKAVQRGKVKAIAIVSGIGYKLFEDGDLQFEDEGKDKKETNTKKPVEECEELKKPKKVEKFEKAEPKATKETKKEEPKPKPSVMDDLEEPTKEEPKILTGLGVIIPDRREDIENEIKRQFLTGGPEKATAIRAYLKENNEKVITSLPEEKLKELYLIIK